MEIHDIALDKLIPPRALRTEGIDVSELVESIREHGLLQPIRVRPVGHGLYQIIAGHRRFLAHRELGEPSISAVVVDESEQAAAVQSIVENLQREDLTPLELAQSIRELATGYRLAFEEIARLVSKSSAQVRTWIRISSLPDDVLQRLESGERGTQGVRGLAPRHVQPFVSDLPTEEERSEDPAAFRKYQERVSHIRALQEEVDRGARINAHMADEIAKSARSGQTTIKEAIDKVLSDPDRYRYRSTYASADELEQDTFAAHQRAVMELATLAYKLKPEIAISFSPENKARLVERLSALLQGMEPYWNTLTMDVPEAQSTPAKRLLEEGKAAALK